VSIFSDLKLASDISSATTIDTYIAAHFESKAEFAHNEQSARIATLYSDELRVRKIIEGGYWMLDEF